MPAIKTYFKAYATSDAIRHIIESGELTALATNPVFSTRDFKAVPQKYRALIPEYIKDYVSLRAGLKMRSKPYSTLESVSCPIRPWDGSTGSARRSRGRRRV